MGDIIKKEPQIRFDSFSDAWEQCKLENILKEFSNKSRIENEFTVLSSTNCGMEIRDGRVSGVSNLGYKIIEDGDLVLSPQNLWLGNININTIGKGLVSPSYKTFKLVNIDSNFIKPQLRTKKMLEAFKNSSTQGASVVRRNLEIDLFYKISLKVPSYEEQAKIGSFFNNLDKAITLHQRKLENLKNTKKCLLRKMFPKDGEIIPDLRFAGFTDDWEQCKFSEIMILRKENGKQGKYNFDIELENLTTDLGTLTGDLTIRTQSTSIFKEGDVLFGRLRPYLNKWWLADRDGVKSGEIWSFKSSEISNNLFIYSLIQTSAFLNEANISSGTKMPRAEWNKISRVSTKVPDIDEQIQLGTFFVTLDNLITLHQRKYDKLINMKKSLLGKMFL